MCCHGNRPWQNPQSKSKTGIKEEKEKHEVNLTSVCELVESYGLFTGPGPSINVRYSQNWRVWFLLNNTISHVSIQARRVTPTVLVSLRETSVRSFVRAAQSAPTGEPKTNS